MPFIERRTKEASVTDPTRFVNGPSRISTPVTSCPASSKVRTSASPRWPELPVTKALILFQRGAAGAWEHHSTVGDNQERGNGEQALPSRDAYCAAQRCPRGTPASSGSVRGGRGHFRGIRGDRSRPAGEESHPY